MSDNILYHDNFEEFIHQIESSLSDRVFKKEKIGTLTSVNVDDLDTSIVGRVQIHVEGVTFQTFINMSGGEKLYVFLSGRSTDQHRIFNRWSWNAKGNAIAIADPMLTTHGIELGWYYGTHLQDYRHLCSKIITKLANLYNILPCNIIIYGSSGGGNAAFYISSYIGGSKSVSINPQIDILKHSGPFNKEIEKKFNLSISSAELSVRNDVYETIISHSNNIFLIIVNIKSRHDFDEISLLAKKLGAPLKYGISVIRNVIFWTYYTAPALLSNGTRSYHNAQENVDIFDFIDYVLENKIYDERLFYIINSFWNSYSTLTLEKKNLEVELSKQHSSIVEVPLCKKDNLSVTEDMDLVLLIARAYRDGKGIAKDVDSAILWYRIASDVGITCAKNELFDVLWRKGTEESLREMIDVAVSGISLNDVHSMGRMGRAYRDGKGVEKNIDLAIFWLRKASEGKILWAKNELFDVLWRKGTEESLREMIDVAASGIELGDRFCMGRMGRAYRDGKGVEKNIDLAIFWLRKASELGVSWATMELNELS